MVPSHKVPQSGSISQVCQREGPRRDIGKGGAQTRQEKELRRQPYSQPKTHSNSPAITFGACPPSGQELVTNGEDRAINTRHRQMEQAAHGRRAAIRGIKAAECLQWSNPLQESQQDNDNPHHQSGSHPRQQAINGHVAE